MRISLLAVIGLILAGPAAGQVESVTVHGRTIVVEDKYQSPTPQELALAEPFRAELSAWYESTKIANDTLREIRRAGKYAEEAETEAERQRWLAQLAQVEASQDPNYLNYLEAERRLTAALGRALGAMTQREKILNPLMNSYVRIVPFIEVRENTIPPGVGSLDDYRAMYERNRSAQPYSTVSFLQWQGGQDPTFEELSGLLALMERHEAFMPGFLHAIAWRESLGNPQEGSMNADERGMFQIQSTDYQPEFGVPLDEPAGSLWDEFDRYCKWIPFNVAVAGHCYERLMKQAEEYGFTGDDTMELAYRFYNESSGYILFCQERLKIYRQLFGISPAELHENDIHTLNRFIYFTEEELKQMYDWPMADGRIAGEALWEAWTNAKIEVTSDLVWKVLLRRLIEQKQYYTLTIDEWGRRWCTVDLTMQNVKRRGSIGINGYMMTAIGICSARGVVPTARIFSAYFYGQQPTQVLTAQAYPTPIPNQPPAVTPNEATLVQVAATPLPTPTPAMALVPAPTPGAAAPVLIVTPQAILTPTPRFTPAQMPGATPTPVFDLPWEPGEARVTPLPAIPMPQAPLTPTPVLRETPASATPAPVVVVETPVQTPATQPVFHFDAPAMPPPEDAPVEAAPVE